MARERQARYGQPEPPPDEPVRNDGASSDQLIEQAGRNRKNRTGSGKPIGVPEDFTASVERPPYYAHGYSYSQGRYPGGPPRPSMVEQGPRYFVGDEWKPASRPIASIAKLQQAMVTAGFLAGDASFRLGVWDEVTRSAYKDLLAYANSTGLDEQSALRQYAMGVPIGGEDGGPGMHIDPTTGELVEDQFQPEPFTPQLPSPDDLRAVFRSAAIDKLGMGMSSKEIEDMVRAFQWKVGMLQADAYQQMVQRDEEMFRTGHSDIDQITTVQAPSAENWLSEELERTRPGEVNAAQAGEDYAPAFFAALGGFA